MGSCVGITLEKKDDNSFEFTGVGGDKSQTYDKVALDESKFSSLRSGENTSFLINNGSSNKNVMLVLTDDLLNKLSKAYDESGKSEEEINKDINAYLDEICNKAISIDSSSHNSISKIEFKFPEKENSDEIVNKISSDSNELGFNIDDIDPVEISNDIKKIIIGQDKLVESVVNNIYNNQVLFEENDENLASSKACILIDGPTGTGKTFLTKQVAKHMNIPIVNRTASMFSAPGYQGANLSDILVDLLKAAKGDLKTAQRGIVVLDEFDKLCDKDGEGLQMKKAVQHELLTYLGGSKIPIEYDGKQIEFDTSKITFICLGAFTNLRERKESELSDKDDTYTIVSEDYIKEGLMREIIGRFSLIACTNSFSKEQLKDILLNSEASPLLNMVGHAKKRYNTDILYDEDIVEKIVDKAYKMNTGARSLETVINSIKNVILNDLITRKYNQIQITEDILNRANETSIRERGPRL